MILALAFALFLFGLTCLVADSGALFRWSQRAEAAAQLAAESGADAVNPAYLYGTAAPCPPASTAQRCHVPLVDITERDRRGGLYAYQRACIQAGDESAAVPLAAPGDLSTKSVDVAQSPEGTACYSDGCRVLAIVTRVVDLPIPLPGFPTRLTVRGRQYAAAVIGSASAHRSCTGTTWVPTTPP